MSATVPITGQVWIAYPPNPAMPWNWRIVDANTGKEFDDVVSMQISVEIRESTVVDLRRRNMAGSERYELVAWAAPLGKIPTEATPELGGEPFKPKPKPKCAECAGSGYYVSPVTGKRSPCSAGCKHP